MLDIPAIANVTSGINAKLEYLQIVERKLEYEGSLLKFVEAAWPAIDSSHFVSCWAIQAMCEHLEAVTWGYIPRLLINIPPRCAKTSVVSIIYPVWVWLQQDISFLSGPQVRFLCASYNNTLSWDSSNKSRRLLFSNFVQTHWPGEIELRADQNTKSRFDNTKNGSRMSTSVGSSLLGLGGDIIIADDLNKVDKENKIETEDETEKVADYWNELHSTRMNDPKQTAIINVQQRLKENDVSGLIIDSEEEWTHLMIPMRYDELRHNVTVVLPRSQDDLPWEDPRYEEGELMWPERFGEKEVRNLESALGPYMCTPAESPVLMSDLSMRPISEVKAGDSVVGFTTDTSGTDFGKYKRRHLRPSKVNAVTIIQAPVVRMTLDSGEVIRCTPDHRWYMGKNGGRRGRNDVRPLYRPAHVGTELMRVCPAKLPELSYEDQRLAGWLSGFFDGEGSVGLCAKNGPQFRKSSTIRFHQGAGRNLPLCERLEKILGHFGFDFTYSEHVRSDRKVSTSDHKNRVYTLYGSSGVPLFQKFLHIAQPNKWRDRIIHGALGTKWITGKEKVVSIEPDGIEQVYALETETGNYVVWGIASSNSAGRLQQSPTPKGGGILKRDWWLLWDGEEARKYGLEWNGQRKEFPHFELVVGSLDTSYGEKEENDYNAMTVWGIWLDSNKNRRAMMMYAWNKRLPLHGTEVIQMPGEAAINFRDRQKRAWGLVEWVADTCKRYKVRRLLIENKTRGKDVGDELKRIYARENWGVELLDPQGDKVSRTHSVVTLFTDGAIWAPDTKWSEAVLLQCARFPRDVHDDMHDTVTQFVNWARENGILLRGDEMSAALDDQMQLPHHDRGIAQQYGV